MTSDLTRFDVPVDHDGYVWWYLDALSDDGAQGLTIIAFVGSVFSPYYAAARHRARGKGGVDPLAHCTINVALYGDVGARWSMTERRRKDVTRSATRLRIGPSAIEWIDDRLRLTLDEVAAPLPRRIRGVVDVTVGRRPAHGVSLDAAGRHHWAIIAPSARIEVRLDAPELSWSGSAYLDTNRGSAPLEQDFTEWDWSRAHLADGRSAVIYDVLRRDGSRLAIADWFDDQGAVGAFDAPPLAALPRTAWRLDRSTRCDSTAMPHVERSFEDGPFYSRSVVRTQWLGEAVTSVHEHLSLGRFERRWVRALLPFRMPRRVL